MAEAESCCEGPREALKEIEDAKVGLEKTAKEKKTAEDVAPPGMTDEDKVRCCGAAQHNRLESYPGLRRIAIRSIDGKLPVSRLVV